MNVQLPRDAVERAVRDVIPKRPGPMRGTGDGPVDRTTVFKLRDRHHAIARLVAAEVPIQIICKRMGISPNTLIMFRDQTPAFQELVEYYRNQPKSEMPAPEEYIDVLERTMVAAELEIADRLTEAPERFSVGELHKISRDAADRLGYSKHSVNLNVNVTLKDRLEGLRRRARGAPAGAGSGGGEVSAHPIRSAPPLLELKANPVQGRPAPERPEAPASSSTPTPPANPDAPMSREQVLAAHKQALKSVETWARNRPAPVKEPLKRRI